MISVDADIPDKPPNQSRVEYWDIILLLLSIIFHFLDIGSDIFVACSYFKSKQYVYFGSTLIILIVTGLVISAVSIKMYRDDKDPTWKALIRPGLCIVGLILQVAPVIRLVRLSI